MVTLKDVESLGFELVSKKKEKTKTPYYIIRFIDLKDHVTEWEEDTYEGACYLMLTRTNLLIEAGDKGVVEFIKVTEDKLGNEHHIELLERKRI